MPAAQEEFKPDQELSKRGWSNVQAILPQIAESLARRTTNNEKEIDLSTAENWLMRSELLALCRDAINTEFKEEHFSYPPGFSGDPKMVGALSTFFNNYFAPYQPVIPQHIATAPGGMPAIDALLYSICDPGDGVLIPTPYWNGFDFGLRVRSSVVPIPANVLHRQLSAETIVAALEDAYKASSIPIKALLISSPHNPLGMSFCRALLEACVLFCDKHSLHFISDEVYAMSVFDNPKLNGVRSFVSVLSLDLAALNVNPSRVHVVWSTSKDFGQSGLRLGVVISQHNKDIIISAAMAAPMQVSSLTTACVTALMTSPNLSELITTNKYRLSVAYIRITSFLEEVGIPYLHANAGVYVFARVAPHAVTWKDESAVAAELKDAGIILGMGKAYHVSEPGWARICFALPQKEMESAFIAMRKVIKPIKVEEINNSKKRKLLMEEPFPVDVKRAMV